LFFECCVARIVCQNISEMVSIPLGADFESVAQLWVFDKKHRNVNVCTTPALWSLWKLRNEIWCKVAGSVGSIEEEFEDAARLEADQQARRRCCAGAMGR
jgi:hypothetical protein